MHPEVEVTHALSCGMGGAGVLVHRILDEPVCAACQASFDAQVGR